MTYPHFIRALALSMVAAGASLSTAFAAPSLLANGNFEISEDNRKAAGWGLPAGSTWETEGTNHFLRLKSPTPGASVTVYQSVTLQPKIAALELNYKVRYEGIKRGKQSWFDGRIMMNFKDGEKRVLQPSPSHPNFSGTSSEWKQRTQQFKVPAGAKTFELMFALFQAESGRLDFDDIELKPVSALAIEEKEQAARTKEAARIAALPKPKPQVPAPSPDKLPPELRVVGNQLKTPQGQAVWLQGVAIPSMEWSATGESILKSVDVAIRDWKANCIRLPVREHFWAGSGPHQNDGGMKYRQLVEDAINACAGHGVHLVLDLHDYRALRTQHVAFWKDIAGRYKNHPAVIFELLNEPHDISWEVWRNGGPVTDKKKTADAATENSQPLVAFQAVGMQQLVEIIRATGARNLIVAGGLDWGYDLSGILNGYALTDPNGNGIVYSSHVYPWKRDWQRKFIDVAAKYPLFLGEVGADTQRMNFIRAEDQEDPDTWVPDMLAVIQKHQLNWTAWSFHPKATPRVILDWTYTPTPFWGEKVKQALQGNRSS